MNPPDFINMIASSAVAAFPETGIFPSAVIAQAALESAWGDRAIGNNLFGIKADPGWSGPVVNFGTHELINGQMQEMTLSFRAYPSWEASIEDHAKFFHQNERYATALQAANGKDFCMAIAAAGYATANGYGELLCSIIDHHQLEQYDEIRNGTVISCG